MFDDTAKLACVQRELAFRRAVYPGQVRKGLISQHEATRQIALMEAIAQDYRDKLQPALELAP